MHEVANIYERMGFERGVLIGQRQTLLQQLGAKFGEVPQSTAAAIEQIQPNPNAASCLVISPDCKLVAYNRRIEGVLQVFVADVDKTRPPRR